MEISFHELENQINILIVLSPEHIVQLDYVRMIHLVQQSDLSESSLSIGGVLESIKYLLECNLRLSFSVNGFPYMPIGPTANFLHQFISQKDVLLYFL